MCSYCFSLRGVFTLVWIIIIAVLVAIIVYSVYTWYAQKRIVKTLIKRVEVKRDEINVIFKL